MNNELEKHCYEQIAYYQEQCAKNCKPYFEILRDIEMLKPVVFVVPDRDWYGNLINSWRPDNEY
jgi:hypothetical protein